MWSTSNPYLNGFFEPLRNEVVIRELRVEGKIPGELDGALYRATANQFFRPLNPDQQHWFDGDAMVHAFHLRDGRASYCNRWVIDDGARAERSVGHALYNGTMGRTGVRQGPLPKGAPAIKVPPNINVVAVGGKVLALNENSARYWQLADDTLETLGAFDFNGAFTTGAETNMLTAHPHLDAATGEFLFTSLDAENLYIDCFAVDVAGRIVSRHRVELDAPAWIHDFAITRNYFVFFLGTFNSRARQPDRLAAGQGMAFHDPDLGSRIMLVNRKSGARTMIGERDLYMVTHFLNACEEEDGRITVHAGLSTMQPSPASLVVADFFPFPMPGKGPSPLSAPELHRWTIDPLAGTSVHHRVGDFNGEFVRMNDAWFGRRSRYGYLAAEHAKRTQTPGFNCLVKADLHAGTFQFQYLSPSGHLPGEPVFVARPGAQDEDDGWVLAIWGDPRNNSSELVILDARNFDGEPLARVALDHHITNGFHGNWIARADIAQGRRAASGS